MQKEKKRKSSQKEKKRKTILQYCLEKKRKTTKIKKLELEIKQIKTRLDIVEKKNNRYRKFIDWLQN